MGRPHNPNYQRDPAKVKAHRERRSIEMRAMIREAAEGMAAVNFEADLYARIPVAHVIARRIWDRFPDTRTLTGRLLGDPIIQRSAWWSRTQSMEAAE